MNSVQKANETLVPNWREYIKAPHIHKIYSKNFI